MHTLISSSFGKNIVMANNLDYFFFIYLFILPIHTWAFIYVMLLPPARLQVHTLIEISLSALKFLEHFSPSQFSWVIIVFCICLQYFHKWKNVPIQMELLWVYTYIKMYVLSERSWHDRTRHPAGGKYCHDMKSCHLPPMG